MDTVVLKFGGSSVADNIKLNIVAEKIKEFYDIILSKNAVIEEKNLPYTINIARFTYFYYKICEEGKEYSDKDLYEYLNNSKEKCEFEDHAEIMINFKNESTGILEVNWLTPYKRRQIEITGTDGIISVDYIEQSIDVYGKFAQDIDIKHEEPLKEELRSFLTSVVNETEPEITGEDGLKALKMVIAATKSSKEHRPISFNELE